MSHFSYDFNGTSVHFYFIYILLLLFFLYYSVFFFLSYSCDLFLSFGHTSVNICHANNAPLNLERCAFHCCLSFKPLVSIFFLWGSPSRFNIKTNLQTLNNHTFTFQCKQYKGNKSCTLVDTTTTTSGNCPVQHYSFSENSTFKGFPWW